VLESLISKCKQRSQEVKKQTHPDEKRAFKEPFGWVIQVILTTSIQNEGYE
jgi:hypothetical protein